MLPIEITAKASPALDNKDPLDALLANLLGDDPLYMFHPLWVIRHTPQLKTLYDARSRLNDLLSKLDGNEDLEKNLKAAASDSNKPAAFVLDASTYPDKKQAKQIGAGDSPKA